MQLKKILAVMLCSAVLSGITYADDLPWTDLEPSIPGASGPSAENQGSGQVIFVGSIVDAPCSVKPSSENQTVQMGSIANALLDAGKASPRQPFSIDLEACSVTTKKSVTVAFNGVSDGTMLAIGGSAKGAGIVIEDAKGIVELGKESAPYQMGNGANALEFGAYMKATGVDKVTPGQFSATTNFVLSYK